MDYEKAKVIIRKLNALLNSFESIGEPISEIESEMLHKYVDKLKSLIPGETDSEDNIPHSKTKTPIIVSPPPRVVVTEKAEKPEVPNTKTQNSSPESPLEIEPKNVKENGTATSHTDDEFDVPPVFEEAVKEKTTKKEPANQETAKAKKKVLVATEEDLITDTSELWEPVQIKELSHKLSFSPVKNIYKAISINDRIFIINELFGGDAEIFKTVLDRLETFDSFEEAVMYLKTGIAKDQNWESSKKFKKANNFMRLVQRRFV